MARREAKHRAALIAAYRQGLGLASIVARRGSTAVEVTAAGEGPAAIPDAAAADTYRWWCRRVADAERVAAAATRQLVRRAAKDGATDQAASFESHSPPDAAAAIVSAARRLRVVLNSDDAVCAEADRVIARVEQEIESLQRTGQLKSINQSYRVYRLEASSRSEKAAPYAVWFNEYKAKLVRELAAALRYV